MKIRGVGSVRLGLTCFVVAVGLLGPGLLSSGAATGQDEPAQEPMAESSMSEPDAMPVPPVQLYTCYGRYALCISAACVKTGETMEFMGREVEASECECEVMFGDNIGSTTCDDRAASQSDTATISTYSMAQTEGKGLLTCNGGPYTDCFNFACKIDPAHPYRAVCECPVLGTMATFITRGGNCDPAACSKLWSAAPSNANAAVNLALWKDLGFVADPPPGYTSKPPENACAAP